MNYSTASQLMADLMNDSPKTMVTIKKYANRRLYNTATSTYVTLETLAGMVKDGIDFAVYDAKTSEDITRSVLTQIIVEEEGKSGQQNLLPISFLRQLIGFYGDNMQAFVPKYLEHSMNLFANNQEQIANYFQTAFGNMFPFGTTLEEMGKKNMEMFERTMRMFAPFATPTTESQDGPVAEAPVPAPEKSKSACSVKIDTPAKRDEPLATVTNISRRVESTPVVAKEPEPVVAKEPEPVVVTAPPAPEPKPEPAAVVVVAPASVPEAKAEPLPSPRADAATATPVEAVSPMVADPMPAQAPEPVMAITHTEPVMATPEPKPALKPVARPIETASAPTPVSATPMPMPTPNVQQTVMANSTPSAEDMQQKIANLQRQLAELAKNRA